MFGMWKIELFHDIIPLVAELHQRDHRPEHLTELWITSVSPEFLRIPGRWSAGLIPRNSLLRFLAYLRSKAVVNDIIGQHAGVLAPP